MGRPPVLVCTGCVWSCWEVCIQVYWIVLVVKHDQTIYIISMSIFLARRKPIVKRWTILSSGEPKERAIYGAIGVSIFLYIPYSIATWSYLDLPNHLIAHDSIIEQHGKPMENLSIVGRGQQSSTIVNSLCQEVACYSCAFLPPKPWKSLPR